MSNNQKLEIDQRKLSEAVHSAYSDNNFAPLEKLLKQGVNINHKQIHDELKYITFNLDAMEKLAILGFDVNTKRDFLDAPMWFEFFDYLAGDSDKLKRVFNIKGLDVNVKKGGNLFQAFDRTLSTMTLDEADDYTLFFIKTLIEKGFDIHFKNHLGNTLLHLIEKSPKSIDLLVSKGLDINAPNKKGRTPLMRFCLEAENNEQYVAGVKKYIGLGADFHVEITDDDTERGGWTALHHAIVGRVPLIIEYLLSVGAKTDQVFQNGESTLDLVLTQNSPEINRIFSDEIAHTSSPNTLKKIIGNHMVTQEYDAVIAMYFDIPDDNLDWEVMHRLSYSYRKTGELKKALKYGLLAVERFGMHNFLLDNLIFINAVKGEFQEAINLWEKYKVDFKAHEDPAANIIAHVVYCFDQLSQQKEGLTSVEDFIEAASATTEIKPGFMHFNLACLYTLVADEANALINTALAAEKGYDAKCFDDNAFDNIRQNDMFKILLNFMEDSVVYKYMTKGDSSISFYSRSNDELELIKDVAGEIEHMSLSFNDLAHLVTIMKDHIDNFKAEGYVTSEIDFNKIWVPVYDDIFKQIGSQASKPLSTINVEWDFDHDQYSLIRPYYVYTDNGFELDHYNFIQYIPTQRIFNNIMSEVVGLDSFKALTKAGPVTIYQSEHDGGNEFSYTMASNDK